MKLNSYVLDIGKVMSGMVFVNILTMVTLPIITRMYNPAVFGSFQTLLAVILTIAAVATLKYDMAIVIPKNLFSARILVKVTFYVLVTFTAFLYVLDLFLHGKVTHAFKIPIYAAWLLPLLIFITQVKPIYVSWLSRNRRYGLISRNNVSENLINRVLMVGLGWLSPTFFSLTVAYVLSKVFTTVNLMTKANINLLHFKRKWLKHFLVAYRKFPLFLTPATFANTLSANAPMILLGFFFNPMIVGYYAVVQRLVNMPMALMQQSMSQVYYERAAKEVQKKGHAAGITLKTFGVLSLLSLVGGVLLFFLGKPIITHFLGKQYAEAGTYLIYLLPWFLFRFIKAPVNYWELINRQEMTLSLHLLQLLLTGGSLLLFHKTANQAILVFSIAMGFYYFVNILIIVSHCIKQLTITHDN